jgi:hypothetical protein
MPRHVGVVLAALLLLAIAAPAASAAPGDRAGAAAIRQATIDLHLAVVAQKAAIQASYRRFSDDPACATAIQGAPTDEYAKLIPEYVFPAMIEMEISPLNPALTAFAARLDQIPVRDSKLRSGRAAWRFFAAKFAQIPAPPADLCARLDAWRQAGYPAASRPAIDAPIFDEILRNDERYDRLNAKLGRSGERLRKLGVSTRVVGWWTGDTLLSEVDPPDDLIPEDS